jgi:hypothetical protein
MGGYLNCGSERVNLILRVDQIKNEEKTTTE